jgi:hypothetical protein
MRVKLSNFVCSLILAFGLVLTAEAAEGAVQLSLQPSTQDVGVGSQFTLNMNLANSSPEQLASLNVWLSFDPDYLEVVDSDAGNWITSGTNVLDGPYHTAFDWDFHDHNTANNTTGRIGYGEGSFATDVTGSGTFAQIKFLAKAPVLNTQIDYLLTGTGGLDDTYVYDIDADNVLGEAAGAAVNVIPEPLTVMSLIVGLGGILPLTRKK